MNRELREALIFISPLVIFILIFLLLPVIGTFWVSLWHDVTFSPVKFLGLRNYLELLKDSWLLKSLRFTLLFASVSVIIEMLLGTITALIINEKFPLRGITRGIILIPWAIPSVVGARIWQLIYRYNYGLFNYILKKISGISINWLGSNTGSFFSLVLTDVWRTSPFVAIIVLAGLQSVPEDLHKQGKIDGANIFQRFFKITLPYIKPILLVALIFRTIDALRVFDIIYVLTGGGPGGFTTSLSLYGYKYFLQGNFGYGSTVSIFSFFVTFIIAILYIKLGRFRRISL